MYLTSERFLAFLFLYLQYRKTRLLTRLTFENGYFYNFGAGMVALENYLKSLKTRLQVGVVNSNNKGPFIYIKRAITLEKWFKPFTRSHTVHSDCNTGNNSAFF